MRSVRSLIPARVAAIAAVATASAGLPAGPAWATVPGSPGKFAVGTFDSIYTTQAGGTLRRIVRRGQEPQWSPDGRRILYITRGPSPAVWSVRSDGTGRRRIAAVPEGSPAFGIFSAAWSPDGRGVVFTVFWEEPEPSDPEGERLYTRFAMYTARTDGTRVRKLREGRELYGPTWSPDGRLIAFVTRNRIAVVRPDGRRFRVLRDNAHTLRVDFSPDSRRLVFLRGAGRGSSIQTLDIRTRRVRTVLRSQRHAWPIDVVWGPAGRRLAYVWRFVPPRGAWPPHQIRTIRTDGTRERRLLTLPESALADTLSWQALRRR